MNSNFQEQFRRAWYFPVFSAMLESRRELTVIAAAGVLHVGASFAGVTLWSCPIREATGVPCPGCGLTRASLELLRGDFSASLKTHAFAPFVLASLFLMLLVLVLPEGVRTRLLTRMNKVETRSGVMAWGITLLFIYWAIRLLGFPPFPADF